MIRSIKVDVNAAFPNMPLLPFQVFHGSAAAITVLNVPRRIEFLSVKVKNVSAVERAFPAQRSGSAWVTIIPGEFLAQSGKSTRGIKIEGVDEAGNIYTVGAADLVVMLDDGTVEPVTPQVTDDTVTRTSANPVKSSGIWSAIWGTLAALPDGFSSLYDWVAAQLAALQDGKRDLDDLDVYSNVFGPWVYSDGVDHGLHFSEGYWRDSDGELWFVTDGTVEHSPFDATELSMFGGGRPFATRTKTIGQPSGDHLAKESQLPTPAEKYEWNGKQSKITASGILKGNGSGGVSTATKSSTAQDPANADYRDPQDNTCHKTEFGKWVAHDVPEGYRPGPSQPTWNEPHFPNLWSWVNGGIPWYYIAIGTPDSTELTFVSEDPDYADKRFTATRSLVCTDGKKFVTFDIVTSLVNGVKTLLGSIASGYSTFAAWISSKFDTAKAVHVFEETSTYEVGEIVLYGGTAYKCTTAVTTAGAWTGSTNWTAATDADIAARLKCLKSDGFATDEFVAECLGKQVANQKIDARIDLKIGDVNAVLAAALDGSEVA